MIKQLLNEGKTFAYIRDLLGVSNGLITNAKNFSPKAEIRARNKKTRERTDNLILRSVEKTNSFYSN